MAERVRLGEEEIKLLVNKGFANTAYADDGKGFVHTYGLPIHQELPDGTFDVIFGATENAVAYAALLKECGADMGKVSDGFHTFDELYEHRILLYIAFAKEIRFKRNVWISKKHSDGSSFDGWFMMGVGIEPGKQISYHLPDSYWDMVKEFAAVKEIAPTWDGHTPADVLTRMKELIAHKA